MRKFLLLSAMLILNSVHSLAQTREVTGTVTDQPGQPVPQATVRIKGTGAATTADQSGVFKIKAPPKSTLVITAVGFATLEVSTTDRSSLSIQLGQDNRSMSEVVVTALGI